MNIQNFFNMRNIAKNLKLIFGVKIQIFSMLKNMSKIQFLRENSDSVQHDKYDKNLNIWFLAWKFKLSKYETFWVVLKNIWVYEILTKNARKDLIDSIEDTTKISRFHRIPTKKSWSAQNSQIVGRNIRVDNSSKIITESAKRFGITVAIGIHLENAICWSNST